MTPAEILLVQRTWVRVVPIKGLVARDFYRRLFSADPSLRTLFKGDIDDQADKLMQVMDTLVNGLTRFDEMQPMLEALGRRHRHYGVKRSHYGAVGAALLATLAETLGDAFAPEAQRAWARLYAAVAGVMLEAGDDTA